jgi:hypothetical protein
MLIYGIDPGKNCGVAVFEDYELIKLLTLSPLQLMRLIQDTKPDMVFYEDSRLQSVVFNRCVNRLSMLKIARNIGEVDGYCGMIIGACADAGSVANGVSPKAKGPKLDAEAFNRITKWTERSNQHERDAAMVALRMINSRVNTNPAN